MPCKDITEILKIKFDADSRVENYSLRKKSCGDKVGDKGQIIKWLRQKTSEEIIATTAATFLNSHPTNSDVIEYLLLKNFLAVKSGVAIMLGKESGSKDDFCTVESIDYSSERTILTAHIKIDAITKEIEACGNCCSSNN